MRRLITLAFASALFAAVTVAPAIAAPRGPVGLPEDHAPNGHETEYVCHDPSGKNLRLLHIPAPAKKGHIDAHHDFPAFVVPGEGFICDEVP